MMVNLVPLILAILPQVNAVTLTIVPILLATPILIALPGEVQILNIAQTVCNLFATLLKVLAKLFQIQVALQLANKILTALQLNMVPSVIPLPILVNLIHVHSMLTALKPIQTFGTIAKCALLMD